MPIQINGVDATAEQLAALRGDLAAAAAADLAAKADTASVNTALSAKADTASVNTALAAKASASLTPEAALRGQWNKTGEVALIIESGQSNAQSVANIGTALPAMPNVFGLPRATNLDAALANVTWAAFSNDGNSLGNDYGTGKTTITIEFARLWQEHITAGNALGLPDLYVIRVPWSSQGIGMNTDPANAKWNILAADTNALTVTNLAFWQQYIFKLAILNLIKTTARSVRVIGNVWIQGEQDSRNLTDARNYQREAGILFDSLDKAAGCLVPIHMVKLRTNQNIIIPEARDIVNQAFDRLAADRIGSNIIDPYNISTAAPSEVTNANKGIYSDGVHYTLAATIEMANMLWTRVVTNGYRGPVARPLMNAPQMNFLAPPGVDLAPVTATANTAKATADAALGTATLLANSYLADAAVNITLPAVTIQDAGSASAAQTLAVIRDATDKKKYFNLPSTAASSKMKILRFNGFKSDTLFGGIQFRAKGNILAYAMLRINIATAGTTFNGSGLAYLFVGIGHVVDDGTYGRAITAGSGNGTASTASDGTSATATTPKVVVYAFDSLAAAGSFRVLSTANINTVTHPAFTTAALATELEFRYTLQNLGANGTVVVEYRAVGATAWTALHSYALQSATILAPELRNGGQMGLVFGVSNNSALGATAAAGVRISAITPVYLE